MGFHWKRNLLIFTTLMLIIQITKGQNDPPPAESEEEDDSSSEETVEDSNESRRRRRRSIDMPNDSFEDPTKPIGNDQKSSRAIPGLPDPATILKIAEILKAVGEQVIPILTSGNSGASDFISSRITRDMKFLKNIKKEIDVLTENFAIQQ